MAMESHAHQGHTRSRRRDEHHQMSMLVRLTARAETVSVGLGTLKNKKSVSSLEYVVLGV